MDTNSRTNLHTFLGLFDRVGNAQGVFTHVEVTVDVNTIVAHERHMGLIRKGEVCDLIKPKILLAGGCSICCVSVGTLPIRRLQRPSK